uniref:Uncharacterized protein n=1 Tax=Rhizophora mucronata TaxID=61149 RepID=A0A2P2P2Z0_RHIMU
MLQRIIPFTERSFYVAFLSTGYRSFSQDLKFHTINKKSKI